MRTSGDSITHDMNNNISFLLNKTFQLQKLLLTSPGDPGTKSTSNRDKPQSLWHPWAHWCRCICTLQQKIFIKKIVF